MLTITPQMLDAAHKMKQANRITSRPILEALRKGEIANFAVLWGALLEVKP